MLPTLVVILLVAAILGGIVVHPLLFLLAVLALIAFVGRRHPVA